MAKSHKKLMLACCVIGVGAAAAVWLFNVPGKSVLFTLMLLLCPLSHIIMMQFMGHENSEHKEHHGQIIDIPAEVNRNAGNK